MISLTSDRSYSGSKTRYGTDLIIWNVLSETHARLYIKVWAKDVGHKTLMPFRWCGPRGRHFDESQCVVLNEAASNKDPLVRSDLALLCYVTYFNFSATGRSWQSSQYRMIECKIWSNCTGRKVTPFDLGYIFIEEHCFTAHWCNKSKLWRDHRT